jgi:hypothetical protein
MFSPEAIAHKFLLSQIPFVFKNEPLKYALFRRTIADAFGVDPTNVFIVGSAMAGRSLKGEDIDKEYSSDSDIDTLVVSEPLFTFYVMRSLEWVRDVSKPTWQNEKPKSAEIGPDDAKCISRLASHACRGIWRPDSLPKHAMARKDFFEQFSKVSLKTLGLQLSDDTVAHVSGRIARSFDDAVADLAASIRRLAREFEGQTPEEPEEELDATPAPAAALPRTTLH